jgi:NAD(P)-dependent dehydrogenase (short-subunit alcohol dehydrogenase family)
VDTAGKVALVTGAGRGIGRSCAIALSRAGFRVALTARTAPELDETASMCDNQTLIIPADLTTGVDEVFDRVDEAFGHADVPGRPSPGR